MTIGQTICKCGKPVFTAPGVCIFCGVGTGKGPVEVQEKGRNSHKIRNTMFRTILPLSPIGTTILVKGPAVVSI